MTNPAKLASLWLSGFLRLLPAHAQQPSAPADRKRTRRLKPPLPGRWLHSVIPTSRNFLLHLAEDQKDIWTSPFHLKPADAKWLVPMSGIATGLFVTDPQSSYAMRLDNLHALRVASDAGVASAAGMTGAMYIWGHRDP